MNRPVRACSTTPEDCERQFSDGGHGAELKQRDIAQILRALRRAKRNKLGEIVITTGEILRDEDLADLTSKCRKEARDTKVKTAISWLERAGFLSREENVTEVFQARPWSKTSTRRRQSSQH